MNTEKKLLSFNTGKFLVYDSATMPYQRYPHLAHFALTDALMTYAGEHQQPILHFWQTPPLIILGMMDTRIGHFNEALATFAPYEHKYMVRNSGGLGVVGDPGVLNVSLIYPNDESRLSIDAGYDFMLDFIQKTFYPNFPNVEIEAYEIPTSYCFGDYDLSINGQKIAGISQRRIQNGVAIMLYISVNGNQAQRAQMLKEFYEAGLDGTEPQGRYPQIDPAVMTTLADAYETDFSVAAVKEEMLSHFDWETGSYPVELNEYYEVALAKMIQRNGRVFSSQFVEDEMK